MRRCTCTENRSHDVGSVFRWLTPTPAPSHTRDEATSYVRQEGCARESLYRVYAVTLVADLSLCVVRVVKVSREFGRRPTRVESSRRSSSPTSALFERRRMGVCSSTEANKEYEQSAPRGDKPQTRDLGHNGSGPGPSHSRASPHRTPRACLTPTTSTHDSSDLSSALWLSFHVCSLLTSLLARCRCVCSFVLCVCSGSCAPSPAPARRQHRRPLTGPRAIHTRLIARTNSKLTTHSHAGTTQ